MDTSDVRPIVDTAGYKIYYGISGETFTEPWSPSFDDTWIAFRAVFNADDTVSFYRDGNHIYTTTAALDRSLLTNQALVVDGRSYNQGQYVDNVKVFAKSEVDLELLNLAATRPKTTTMKTFSDIRFDLRNNGPTDLVSQSVMVDYYLSDDTVFGDGDDRLIGDTGFSLDIAAGSTTSIILSPTGLTDAVDLWTDCLVPNGNYYLFAKARINTPLLIDPVQGNDHDLTNDGFIYTGCTDVRFSVVPGVTWVDPDPGSTFDVDIHVSTDVDLTACTVMLAYPSSMLAVVNVTHPALGGTPTDYSVGAGQHVVGLNSFLFQTCVPAGYSGPLATVTFQTIASLPIGQQNPLLISTDVAENWGAFRTDTKRYVVPNSLEDGAFVVGKPFNAADANLTVDEDAPWTAVNLGGKFTDGNGLSVPGVLIDVTNPSHGETKIEGGFLYYRPSPDYSGADSFQYTAKELFGEHSDTATVYVTINSVPDLYALTVVNGTGSGTYAAGTVVPLAADPPPPGQVFDRWTATPGPLVLNVHNSLSPNTAITMPAATVSVKANYRFDDKLEVLPVALFKLAAPQRGERAYFPPARASPRLLG